VARTNTESEEAAVDNNNNSDQGIPRKKSRIVWFLFVFPIVFSTIGFLFTVGGGFPTVRKLMLDWLNAPVLLYRVDLAQKSEQMNRYDFKVVHRSGYQLNDLVIRFQAPTTKFKRITLTGRPAKIGNVELNNSEKQTEDFGETLKQLELTVDRFVEGETIEGMLWTSDPVHINASMYLKSTDNDIYIESVNERDPNLFNKIMILYKNNEETVNLIFTMTLAASLSFVFLFIIFKIIGKLMEVANYIVFPVEVVFEFITKQKRPEDAAEAREAILSWLDCHFNRERVRELGLYLKDVPSKDDKIELAIIFLAAHILFLVMPFVDSSIWFWIIMYLGITRYKYLDLAIKKISN